MKKIVVNVSLKPEILDPQGKAVLEAIRRQGLQTITDVRQGKQFVLTFEDETAPFLLREIQDLAKNLLSNPVIEDYSIEVQDEA